eukprot:679002-Amphidinium_carterae.1
MCPPHGPPCSIVAKIAVVYWHLGQSVHIAASAGHAEADHYIKQGPLATPKCPIPVAIPHTISKTQYGQAQQH